MTYRELRDGLLDDLTSEELDTDVTVLLNQSGKCIPVAERFGQVGSNLTLVAIERRK